MKQIRTWALKYLIIQTALSASLLSAGCAESAADSLIDNIADWDSETEADAGDNTSSVEDDFVPQFSTDESLSVQISAEYDLSDAEICALESASPYLLGKQTSSEAGAVLARAFIRAGSVPVTPIRDMEFLNYYMQESRTNTTEEPRVLAAFRRSDNTDDSLPLLLSVSAPTAGEAVDAKLNLVLAVDVSESMAGEDAKTARVACQTAVEQLIEGDAVTILTWNAEASTLFGPALVGDDKLDLINACDELPLLTGLETDLHVALSAAYDAADVYADASMFNHIVLISDGGSSAGVTDKSLVQSRASDADVPIFLSTLGISTQPELYNEALLRMFADAGLGGHYYADTAEEARKVMVNRLFPSFAPAVENAQFHLSLPPGFRALDSDGSQAESPVPIPLFSGRTTQFLVAPEYCGASASAKNNPITFTLEFTRGEDEGASLISAQMDMSTTQSAEVTAVEEKADIILAYAATLRALQSESTETVAERISAAEALLEESSEVMDTDESLMEIADMLTLCKGLTP